MEKTWRWFGKKDKISLKKAMDIAGVWYDGFLPEDTTGIISVDREKISEVINTYGGIDNFTKALATVITDSEIDKQKLKNVMTIKSTNTIIH